MKKRKRLTHEDLYNLVDDMYVKGNGRGRMPGQRPGLLELLRQRRTMPRRGQGAKPEEIEMPEKPESRFPFRGVR